MGGGVWKGVAVGAGGGARFSNAVKEGLEKLAESRSQLSQDVNVVESSVVVVESSGVKGLRQHIPVSESALLPTVII